MDEEKQALAHFLTAQRAAVLAIVAGLDGTALTTAVLPSGWTRSVSSSTTGPRNDTGSRRS